MLAVLMMYYKGIEMADKLFRLKVFTPFIEKVDEDVNMVVLRCQTGDWGVLAGHAPFSAVLRYGTLRMINGDNERVLAVYGGVASVKDNVLTVLTSEAEWPDEIDLARVQSQREQAEQRLRERTDYLEMQYDRVLIRRALVQIEVKVLYEKTDEND
ncbi:MAG: ATP synthase F1 subunit epsilon [Oscillospiraceae bacterium]|nr:ATP synthase F1 subunit epsilon [Oscillospiraceae bacterium]